VVCEVADTPARCLNCRWVRWSEHTWSSVRKLWKLACEIDAPLPRMESARIFRSQVRSKVIATSQALVLHCKRIDILAAIPQQKSTSPVRAGSITQPAFSQTKHPGRPALVPSFLSTARTASGDGNSLSRLESSGRRPICAEPLREQTHHSEPRIWDSPLPLFAFFFCLLCSFVCSLLLFFLIGL